MNIRLHELFSPMVRHYHEIQIQNVQIERQKYKTGCIKYEMEMKNSEIEGQKADKIQYLCCWY